LEYWSLLQTPLFYGRVVPKNPDVLSIAARAWFANVKERKNLINCAKNKLLAAVDIIRTKHPSERVMVFSETIESIQMLKDMLQNRQINSMLIESKLKSRERKNTIRLGKRILSATFRTYIRNRI
jgi:superfamily II DNA/RNA helicase